VLHDQHPTPGPQVYDFIKKAEPFITDIRPQSRWPGGGRVIGTAAVVYLALPESLDLLKAAAHGLYDWVHSCMLLEDLAFYRADSDDPEDVLLATIGHELAGFMLLDQLEQARISRVVPGLHLGKEPPSTSFFTGDG
jgi:hypothetical protein